MMWYVQLMIERTGALLAQDAVFNAVFALLALWSAFGQSPRVCAVLTALVHLYLVVS
ncbi:hypothetical protein [Tropicibacter sp. Alg240-R139]|uniref:hypothetical protein n=1 Tax=Tropicibacter sp. Alg240-R139 TaxID=2305991 RepID=UPI0013E049C1|nr:hypothetical protein [Tropicibacter sp. Alg240-R139]